MYWLYLKSVNACISRMPRNIFSSERVNRIRISLCTLEAAKTYFTSCSGSQRLQFSGKYDDKCIQQRCRNRVMRVSKFVLPCSGQIFSITILVGIHGYIFYPAETESFSLQNNSYPRSRHVKVVRDLSVLFWKL